MSYRDALRAQLRVDEGERRHPYRDSVGILSVGVGRNLEAVGLRDDEIALMLENDIEAAEQVARALLPNFDAMSDTRKAAICNLAFNVGAFVLAGFTNTLKALREERWDDAAAGILDSRYATQVGKRAVRVANAIRGDVA